MFIYRCSDGHLVRLSLARRLLALHLGTAKFARCPKDDRWRMLRLVHRNQLTDSQLSRLDDSW